MKNNTRCCSHRQMREKLKIDLQLVLLAAQTLYALLKLIEAIAFWICL